MSADENNWRTPQFRQSVVTKIDEAIRASGMATVKKGTEMESHVFQKAKTREEYLGFVARLILHVRELNQKKSGSGMPNSGGVQDPINALQNLARQELDLPEKVRDWIKNGSGNNMLGGLPPPPGPQQPQSSNPAQCMNPRPVLQQRLTTGMPPAGGVMMPGGSPLMPRKAEPGGFRNSYIRQSPTPPQSSPVSLAQAAGMVSSPALAPSPGGLGGGLRTGMASSPQLNTPGQQPVVSPACTMNDETAYREKIRHLSKYIEPLRRMIARVGNDDLEKISKMKALLDILTNGKRLPLETLRKCEIVLEKINLKTNDMGVREQHPLIDALRNNLHSPVINHTLQRTFGPCIEALFGSDIRNNAIPPIKRKRTEEAPDDIPEVLQGEIARLDQRFKVSLDGRVSGGVQLVCWLDDRHLPCVPPISLQVPEDYPATPPRCHLSEASGTPFLARLEAALASRVSKLPAKFTVSQLLDTWEMSVRQACAPIPPSPSTTTSTSILLGL